MLDAVAHGLADAGVPESGGELIADRARGQRDWVYSHVVIDEAQELSGMQWRMVLRRCPTRSITAVGDIDQAEASHRHTSWAEAVGGVFGDRWTTAELTICYRTPREVMELTGPVLQKAGSRNDPPRACTRVEEGGNCSPSSSLGWYVPKIPARRPALRAYLADVT